MQISRPDGKTVLLSHLDALLTELIRRIPRSADPGDNAAARARLFSAPTHDEEEAQLLEDWQEYIRPELQRLFQTALEVIESDLKGLEVNETTGEASLSIATAHLEQWIHGLNQARLTLSARYDFTEEEMDHTFPLRGDQRALALLQMYSYAELQELFLQQLGEN